MNLKMRWIPSGVALLLALLLVFPPTIPTVLAATTYSYDFESTLSPWGVDFDSGVVGSLTLATSNNLCPFTGT